MLHLALPPFALSLSPHTHTHTLENFQKHLQNYVYLSLNSFINSLTYDKYESLLGH